MAVTTPDWLTHREGDLRVSADGQSASIYFAGQLQYVLISIPAKGKFACRITETINGRRLDGDTTYSGRDEAFRGGLDELRNRLGW